MLSDPMCLTLSAPIDTWDEAIPMGNGLTGALIWGNKNQLHISMDRGDIWDNRIVEAFTKPEFSWNTIQKAVHEKNQTELTTRFDRPYDKIPYPTKLPVGRITLEFAKKVSLKSFQLNLHTGEVRVQFQETSQSLTLFFLAEAPLLLIQSEVPICAISFKGPGDKRNLKGAHSALEFKHLGYRKYTKHSTKNSCGFHQSTLRDGDYSLYGAYTTEKKLTYTAIGVSYSLPKADSSNRSDHLNSFDSAVSLVTNALKNLSQISEVQQKARTWWQQFWGSASISLPDVSILLHYQMVEYFYGAASRKGAYPLPLQGVWTADTAALPPWKGDYHFDLNVQLSYWACLTPGHFTEAECLLDFLWNLMPEHERFAKSFYGVTGGIAVPGVMTLTGKPMAGWAMYSLSPVQGIWVAQHFYWQWRYTQDREFLTTKAYPYLKSIAHTIMQLLRKKPDGLYYLPLSSSPEIFDNTLKAWLEPNSNYDLSLMKWLFGALLELANDLQNSTDQRLWQQYCDCLSPLHQNLQHELLVCKDQALPESHRHFSHLMAIYPLQLLDADNPEDQAVISSSLAQLDRLGTKQWCGYSFAWASILHAQNFDGERAYENLRIFVSAFVTRNYFHVNGDQSGQGYSNFNYRPFTLEGNFAAAHAVHEMLVQSTKNKIRIFPAVPVIWQNVSFEHLYVQGGHIISAVRENGKTIFVRIIAGSTHEAIIKHSFSESPMLKVNDLVMDPRIEGNILLLKLQKGQKIELKCK